MANGITLSAGVRANLLSLQNTAQLMQTTQNRLATGKKVNSALDNPINFFTSQSLQSRAGDLNSLLDSMSNGIQTIQAANNGLTSITSTVQSMQSTLNQALQDSSWQTAAYSIDSTTIGTGSLKNLTFSGGAVTGTINVAVNSVTAAGTQSTLSTSSAYLAPSTAEAASYSGGTFTALGAGETYTFKVNGQDISLDDTTGDTLAHAVTAVQDQLNTRFGNSVFTVAQNAGGTGLKITGKADGTNDVVISNQAAAGGATAAGLGLGTTTQTDLGTPADTYDFTVNGDTVSVAAGTGLAAAITSINGQLTSANSKFEAFNDSGALGIREITAEGTALTLAGTDASSLFGGTLTNTGTAATTAAVKTVDQLVASINGNSSLTGKVKASNDNGSLRIMNLSLSDLTVVGASSSAVNGGTGGSNTQTIAGNSVRKGLVQQFNTLRDQLDKFAGDSSYNGINLLSGDNLRLTLNETGSSTINIQAKDSNGNTLSINSTNLGINAASNSDFDSNTAINSVLSTLTTSLATLRSQGSAFGSNLSAVQNRQDFTKAMINTLQTGGDNLVLADTNEEGANLLALQTRQSLSTTALSLSAQADQAVLSLFG